MVDTIRLLEHLGIKDRQSSRYEEYKWFSKTIKRHCSSRKIYQNTSSYMISYGEFWEFLTGKPHKEVREPKSQQSELRESCDTKNLVAKPGPETTDAKALMAIQRYQKPQIATERREIGCVTGGVYRLFQEKENKHPSQRLREQEGCFQPGKIHTFGAQELKEAKQTVTNPGNQDMELQELRKLRADLMKEGNQ